MVARVIGATLEGETITPAMPEYPNVLLFSTQIYHFSFEKKNLLFMTFVFSF